MDEWWIENTRGHWSVCSTSHPPWGLAHLTGLGLAQCVLVVLGQSFLGVPQHRVRIVQGCHCHRRLTFINCLIDGNHRGMHWGTQSLWETFSHWSKPSKGKRVRGQKTYRQLHPRRAHWPGFLQSYWKLAFECHISRVHFSCYWSLPLENRENCGVIEQLKANEWIICKQEMMNMILYLTQPEGTFVTNAALSDERLHRAHSICHCM